MNSNNLNSKNVRSKNYLLSMLLLVSCPVFANEFTGAVSVLTGQSDNALKATDEKIDERQDEYRVNIGGNYANEVIELEAEYSASDYRFAEDSQESEQFLEGNSSVLIGKEHQPADLLITHSRKTLLRSSDEKALIKNQDEREILALSPTLRANISSTDSIYVTGSASQISYTHNELFDSTRSGATVGWSHDISRIQAFKLAAQQIDVEFDNLNDANYTYRRAEIIYGAALRRLTYNMKAGYNETESQLGLNFDGPTYDISLAYKSGLHEITLISSQVITDTSLGGANMPSVDGSPSSDGERMEGSEQIERLNSELRWESFVVCDKCNVFVSIYQRDESYLIADLSAKTRGLATGFIYRLSKPATISVRTGKNNLTYTGLDLGKNYDLRQSSIEYSYKFINGLSVKLFAQQEKRTSDSLDQRYLENYVGGGLEYTF